MTPRQSVCLLTRFFRPMTMSLECEIINNDSQSKVSGVNVVEEDFGVSRVPKFQQDGEEDPPHVYVDAKLKKVLNY